MAGRQVCQRFEIAEPTVVIVGVTAAIDAVYYNTFDERVRSGFVKLIASIKLVSCENVILWNDLFAYLEFYRGSQVESAIIGEK